MEGIESFDGKPWEAAVEVSADDAAVLEFRVARSNGGNVGARSIEVYSCPSATPAPVPATGAAEPEVDGAAGRRSPAGLVLAVLLLTRPLA